MTQNLPKHKYLLSYRYTEIIHDLTLEFCNTYIEKRSRTHDQMVQAARSGKQNIVEGVAQGQTSKKGEIKLLGVAKSSFEELINDYEDFLRQRSLTIYPKESQKIGQFRSIGFRLREKPILPGNSTDAANFLLTLAHQASYLLFRQIEAAEKKFLQEGGYTESLFKRRLSFRNSLK